ncbi:MAG: hypothetical protein J7647_24725 [Cyanobacteria bacterium SBLK]|nr:hypothetical protein [Cyanobacteria bacterium SBLK]
MQRDRRRSLAETTARDRAEGECLQYRTGQNYGDGVIDSSWQQGISDDPTAVTLSRLQQNPIEPKPYAKTD